MEKFMKGCDKESMRLAMLKHEETFREQVRELHRLYQVQKILMRNIQSKKQTEEHQERRNLFRRARFVQTRDHDDTKVRRFLLEQPAQDQSMPDFCGNRFVEETIEETEIKLTLGPSCCIKRKKPERTLTSESIRSLSFSTESSLLNRTCDIKEVRLFQVPSQSESDQSNVEIEERLRKERLEQPTCVFQVFSLNMA